MKFNNQSMYERLFGRSRSEASYMYVLLALD